jgi:hypothetical protein
MKSRFQSAPNRGASCPQSGDTAIRNGDPPGTAVALSRPSIRLGCAPMFLLFVAAFAAGLTFDDLDRRDALRYYEEMRRAEQVRYAGSIDYPVRNSEGRTQAVADYVPERMNRRNFCERHSPHDDCDLFIRDNVRSYLRSNGVRWAN